MLMTSMVNRYIFELSSKSFCKMMISDVWIMAWSNGLVDIEYICNNLVCFYQCI